MILSMLLLVGALGSPAASSPADTIVVGHPALARLRLRVGTDTSEAWVMQNETRRVISTTVTTVSEIPTGYLVTYRNESPRGVGFDSIWVDRGTMATRQHVEVTAAGWKRLVFDGRHLTGIVKDTAGEHGVDITLTSDALDNSVVSVIAAALPLARNFETTLASYDVGGQYMLQTVRVVGEESVEYRGAPRQALKVQSDYTSGPRAWRVTHWLDTISREELKWEMSISGRQMFGARK